MSTKKTEKDSMNVRYILFSVVTFILFLLLMEGGIRTYFCIKNKIDVRARNFTEYLGWETAANISKKSDVKGYGEITYSTQRYGFRRFGDTETDKTKIFIIGDSFTDGYSVSDGNAYYDYLTKHDDNIEIFAYGSGGYGTLQEFMILDRYFDEIKPDLVLLQFCHNDFINNSHELESASLVNNNQMTRPYYKDGAIEWLFPRQYGGWLDKMVQSSYFLRLLNIRLNILTAEKRDSIEWKLSPGHPLFRESAKITSDIMGFVRQRIGDTPMLAFSVDVAKWMGSAFQDICEENSIDFIPGIPQAIAKAKQSGIVVDGLPYDGHWNSVGHAIVGEIILRYLKGKGYLHKQDRSIPKTDPKASALLNKYKPVSDDIVSIDELSIVTLSCRNSEGFGNLEGPYPQWHMPRKVRWMTAPKAAAKLAWRGKLDVRYSLHMKVLSQAMPQSLIVLFNGVTILEKTIESANKWYVLDTEVVHPQAGENILEFQAPAFKRNPDSHRDLHLLFEAMEFQSE